MTTNTKLVEEAEALLKQIADQEAAQAATPPVTATDSAPSLYETNMAAAKAARQQP